MDGMQRLRCFSAALAYASLLFMKENKDGTVAVVAEHDGGKIVERKERGQLDDHTRRDDNDCGERPSSPTGW